MIATCSRAGIEEDDARFLCQTRESTERTGRRRGRFVVLEGVGHWIPETAAERFSAELLAHLAAHRADG